MATFRLMVTFIDGSQSEMVEKFGEKITDQQECAFFVTQALAQLHRQGFVCLGPFVINVGEVRAVEIGERVEELTDG